MDKYASPHAAEFLKDALDDLAITGRSVRVLVVGDKTSGQVFRAVLPIPDYEILHVSTEPNAGADIVLTDLTRVPLPDGCVDLAILDETLQCSTRPWQSLAEMRRLLASGGNLLSLTSINASDLQGGYDPNFIIVPRSLAHLADAADVVMISTVVSDEATVFGRIKKHYGFKTEAKAAKPKPVPASVAYTPGIMQASPPTKVAVNNPEATRGQEHYLKTLAQLHALLQPNFYMEIGVREGDSLRLAMNSGVGIDPAPALKSPLPPHLAMLKMTSDDFFAKVSAAEHPPVDLAFIDGMHLFEFALRDFINIEQRCRPAATVVFDDIYPSHPAQAQRERKTSVWTGDIWKLRYCLGKYRPDLRIFCLDTHPSGLMLVQGLDPANRVLADNYDRIVAEFMEPQFAVPPAEMLERRGGLAPNLERIPGLVLPIRA